MEEVTKMLYSLYFKGILWQRDSKITPYKLQLNYNLIIAIQNTMKHAKINSNKSI